MKYIPLIEMEVSENELLTLLRRELESLRVQYIKMTEEWAKNYFNHAKKQVERYYKLNTSRIEGDRKRKTDSWNEYKKKYPNYNDYSKGFTIDIPKYIAPGFSQQSEEEKNLEKFYQQNRGMVSGGQKKFVDREIRLAQNHFEDSLRKLVDRIEKKGLNKESLRIKTSHVGVHIETTLTDGEKTVKAWTIIAEGPVQRPHYRYLVK